MSRLAKRPIVLPKGVTLSFDPQTLVVTVKGPKGELKQKLMEGITPVVKENELVIECENSDLGAFHGLYFSLIKNMLIGTSEGFEKRLNLVGVGFRAAVTGNAVDLQVGFSHPTKVDIPNGVTVKVDKGTEIIISGNDKQIVGQFAASLRAKRPPEPYKGKGIRYKDEYVRKKAGKAAKGGK